MAALCILSPVAWFCAYMFHPSAGGRDTSLARMSGAAWSKEEIQSPLKVGHLGGLCAPPFQILVAPFPRPSPRRVSFQDMVLQSSGSLLTLWAGNGQMYLPGTGWLVRVTSGALDAPSSGRG